MNIITPDGVKSDEDLDDKCEELKDCDCDMCEHMKDNKEDEEFWQDDQWFLSGAI